MVRPCAAWPPPGNAPLTRDARAGLHFVFADGNDVHMVPMPTSSEKQSSRNITKIAGSSRTLVVQVKWCMLGKVSVLAIASNDSLRVVDATGTSALFTFAMTADGPCLAVLARARRALTLHSLCAVRRLRASDVSAFFRGITTAVVDGSPLLYVGTSLGDTLVLSERGALVGTLAGAGVAICELTSPLDLRLAEQDRAAPTVLSADEAGTINVWSPTTQTLVGALYAGEGVPCTCVRLFDDTVVACFADGMIRTFSLAARTLTVQIAAHTRAISGLAVVPRDKLFATVSYDCRICVWALGADKVVLANAIDVPNSLLQGASPCADGEVAVVAYDSHRLRMFRLRDRAADAHAL